MESSTEDKSKQDVMVSNLPLLFSDGKPTSINSMSAEDFQYFIPFLLKCILGCEPSGWAKHAKFKWWPSDVPWSPIILTKKHQTQNWKNKLQKLVKNCYEYNGCTYLLHFSAKLQTLSGGYRFDDNWDGTTSMYDSTSGKLLVTFQNENMNYDKGFRQQSSANRPMLLPRLNSPNSPTKMNTGGSNNLSLAIEAPPAAKMVEPPANDIYLCDYCGADFSSLSAIKAHEAKCMADKALEAHSSNTFTEIETEDMDEAKFLWYLSLSGRNRTVPPANVTPAKVRPVVRRACTLSDKRFTTIPFSSNLGQSFFKATKLTLAAAENLINRYERLCPAKPISVQPSSTSGEHTNHPNPSGPTSYRFRSVFQKRKEDWVHSYSFNRADRIERMKTINTGLNKRGRQLLRQCQDVRVMMKRMQPDEIEMWTRPKPKQSQLLLQPWLQRTVANLPSTCTISLAPVDSPQTWLRRQHASSPSLTVSRPEMLKHTMAVKQHLSSKHQMRSPPGLLPLITNTWSMQTMQSVKPKPKPTNNQFILPDLIPVINSNAKTRPPDPVIIRMSALPSPRSASSSTNYQATPGASTADVIDLCSSEDETDEKKGSAKVGTHSKSLVIPPGISITKVQKTPNGINCRTPFRPQVKTSERPKVKSAENNNNPSRGISQWLESSLGSLPVLKFMGQHPTIKKEPVRNAIAPASPADSSLPIVTPLKLGKLPAEKREQMKQSLLKIQQKERKSPSSVEKGSPSKATQLDSDEIVSLQLSPSLQTAIISSKDVTRLLGDECKELKHKGLSDLLISSQRLTRRKRAKEPEFYSCDEEDYLSDGPNKKTKLDQSPSLSGLESRMNFNDNYSTVIEVDVGGADTEAHDSSRSSSFGSLTPDSKRPRKRNELFNLLKDECKELKRKGLEDLSFEADPNQRITRCRTKSLPIVANKR